MNSINKGFHLVLWLVVGVTFLVQSASGCSFGPKKPAYWPTNGWRTSTPETQGMDSEKLAQMIEYIQETHLNLHSLTIIRHGYCILDAYFWPFTPDTKHDIASCTKSITSTLIGIAIDNGHIKSVRQPIFDFFTDKRVANLNDEKRSLTVEHLLTMTAGMECITEPYEVTVTEMIKTEDWTGFALGLPMIHKPGTHFAYSSTGSHLLSAVVSRATGMPLEDYARKNLFEPLGIGTVYWPKDPQGYNHGWGNLQMTPRDMAKIGFLFLHKGLWDEDRVVSQGWVKTATRNHTRRFGPKDGYGYQWWPYQYGSFYATGRGGQRIFVVPLLDLVVVVTAGATSKETDRYESILGKFILPAIKPLCRSIPPNPQAFARLESKQREIALPPRPKPVPRLPETASRISNRTWLFGMPNPMGWEALTLVFENGSNQALATVTIEGTESGTAIGLDNVPRLTSKSRFAADPRYQGQTIALNGYWESETFVIHFNTLALIDLGTITMNFQGDSVRVELLEKTFTLVPVQFFGRLKK